MGRLVLVTGGSRSGKSRYAEWLAEGSGAPVLYLATMEVGDDETAQRIARHRDRRPKSWQTVEEPFELARALAGMPSRSTVLVECLATWCGNLFWRARLEEEDPVSRWQALVDRIVAEAGESTRLILNRDGLTIVVTNEVGWGIVPEGRLSRYYRDALGQANQAFAAAAERVLLIVAGRALALGVEGPPPIGR